MIMVGSFGVVVGRVGRFLASYNSAPGIKVRHMI